LFSLLKDEGKEITISISLSRCWDDFHLLKSGKRGCAHLLAGWKTCAAPENNFEFLSRFFQQYAIDKSEDNMDENEIPPPLFLAF